MSGYPKLDLDDAVVLITGGARGIGFATAERFAALGSTVVLADLDADELAASSKRLDAFGVHLDVTSRASFSAAVDSVLERYGRIDVLVNNAGVMPLGDFLSEDDAVTVMTLDVNVRGLVNGMQLVLPGMIERGHGHVVNVCSMAGKIPIPGMAVYNASKFAAVGLTAAVRREYADTGVSVSAVLPAAVRTRLASGVPLGRGLPTVEPEQVADAVVESCRNRRGELPVPGWLTGWDLLDAVAPEPLMRLGRRLIGDRRGLRQVDETGRADYQDALGEQVRNRTR